MERESNENWYEHIPVTINNHYGDAFIESQIDNTIGKMNQLKTHKTPISIVTKAPYSDIVLGKLRNEMEPNDLYVINYSLTGLNEGGFSFENRVNFIKELNKIFGVGNINILTRPIIKNRNDDMKILERIVEVAEAEGCNVVLGGLHDEEKRKVLDATTEEDLIEICEKHNVKSFFKSSCAAAYIKGFSCWVHSDASRGPINLDIVEQMGYDFEYVANQGVILPKATVGDLNFLRMVTQYPNIFTKEITLNEQLLSNCDHVMCASSSWFSWATNRQSCLGCDYCIINDIPYAQRKKVEIGCAPKDILKHMGKRFATQSSDSYLKASEGKLIGYNIMRKVRECSAKKYR